MPVGRMFVKNKFRKISRFELQTKITNKSETYESAK